MEKLIQQLKELPTRIVFADGKDPRVLEAASRLKQERVLEPILYGTRQQILSAAQEHGFDVQGIEILDPAEASYVKEMAERMVELRRGKWSLEECCRRLREVNYFTTMYVEMGYADGLLGGAATSTADTVRPALQLIKAKPGNLAVSSCFLMTKDARTLVMADCSLNVDPDADQLVEITLQTARTARQFGIEPKIGLLSYSTYGSGSGESVNKVREAVVRLKRMPLDYEVDGEMQVDCALSPRVARLKAPQSPIAGQVNTLIFPNIDAGNIGYKLVAQLGEFEALGPILQGLNAPINDLSRGCNANEVYKMAIITAAQKHDLHG